MNFKTISTIFVILITFTIFTLIHYNSNLVFSEVSESTISDYEFHGYLEQMKGHLDASIINVQSNNSGLAVAHALHPIEEIVDIINNRLIQTNEKLINIASEEFNEAMFNGQIINLLEYQDGQQFIKRAIMLLEESQAFLSDNDKKYLTQIREMKKDLDLKSDPSEIDRNVKDMLCEIKKGFYC